MMHKHSHYREMPQGDSASWSDHLLPTGVPAGMDFTYDGLYNTFGPSVLSQTLCELDIDNSIHKLFEGLPEILEETQYSSYRDGEVALGRPAVTVASSPLFPSMPPAQGCRPSSMPAPAAPDVMFMTAAQNATPPVTFLASSTTHGQELEPSDHRKGARARKGKWTGSAETTRGKTSRTNFKVPRTSRGSPKVLDAVVPSIALPQISPHVASMVPKILPATAMPAVDLRTVKTNDVHMMHPSVALGPQAILRMPKRIPKEPPPHLANTRTLKTRYFDKVEHIVRERWRRDDMAGKFLALESLLPPGSKRDRSTIVDDSMKLVKSLQHRKETALMRCTELKLASQSPGIQKPNQTIQNIGSLMVIPMPRTSNSTPAREESLSSSSVIFPRPLAEACTTVVTPGPPNGTDKQLGQVPQELSDCVKRFYVQSELLSGDIVIELICEQIPHFHSTLLKSMETLGFEVIRCSFSKTMNKLICNVTVKPFPYSDLVNQSSTSIMEGLSSAFQKV